MDNLISFLSCSIALSDAHHMTLKRYKDTKGGTDYTCDERGEKKDD